MTAAGAARDAPATKADLTAFEARMYRALWIQAAALATKACPPPA